MKKVKIDFEKLKGALWRKHHQVAADLGIHRSSLSRKINAKRSITIDELNLIAEALGRNTMDFLVEIDEKAGN